MKKIAIVYEITDNPYITNTENYSNRISEFVYPSEINDICNALHILDYQYDIIDGPKGLLESINSKQKFDLVFNKSIGFKGLERKIAVPAICQMYNLPRIGSGAYAMTLARHKYHTNRILNGLGFNVPFAYLYERDKNIPQIPYFPVIIKPNDESDSLGISEKSICFSIDEIKRTIEILRKDFNQPFIIEEYIPGEEWKVAVIGNDERTHAYGCVNSLKNGCSMVNTLQTRDDILNNTLSFAPVKSDLKQEALETAERIHNFLGLNDYSRCDFRIGTNGKLYCMEVSTHPDISRNTSSFVIAALEKFNTYSSVIKEIIFSAEKRYNI